MKIIVLGAGQVGASVAESLSSESNDITIVDTCAERLAYLQDRLDLRTVVGNAASPVILGRAGAEDADMLIAVTLSDETNLVACKVAHSLFNVPTRIARLRTADLLDAEDLLSPENFAVDLAICPEQIITDYIARLIQYPEALQVVDFADGQVSLVAIRCAHGDPLVGRRITELSGEMTDVDMGIAALYRNNKPIVPQPDTVISVGDEIFCVAASRQMRQVMRELRRSDKPVRNVMIASAGNIGLRVARTLEKTYSVKVLERDPVRADLAASVLTETLVLRGDATDEDLLEEESIADMDVFLALTNDDEDNIMAASLAKRMGAGRVLALINRRAYADLVQGGPIDIGISPAQISIGTLLAYVRHGDVARVHSLRRGAAEALEVVAHGDRKTSRVVGRRVGELKLPDGASIGALVRQSDHVVVEVNRHNMLEEVRPFEVIIPSADTIIETDDHAILFVVNKRLVPEVEKLFQVSFGFL